MLKKKTIIHFILFLESVFILFAFSCNKRFGDIYPEAVNSLPVNYTIRELKALHKKDSIELIKEDKIISGIVIANDKSGNFYQSVIIQDETGGIVIRMNSFGLYTSYPEGRRLFVKLKGLYLGDYGGVIQIGGGIDNTDSLTAIAPTLFDNYIVKGSFNNIVVPKQVDVLQFTTNIYDTLQSTLIQLSNFQFNAFDTSKQYADTTKAISAVSYTLRNCTNQSIQVRSSSYSNFAGIKLAAGNGTITAVYSIFNTSKQLTIRDTSDIRFVNPRCNQQYVDTTKLITIKDLRALYKTSSVTLPFGTVIKATVISNSKNEVAGSYKIQDLSGSGITFFSAIGTPVYPQRSTILINASNALLQLYNGDLELTNVPIYNVYISNQAMPVPRITNIKTIKDSADKWINTLVTISNVLMTKSSSTSNGLNYNLNDGSGILPTFIRDSADFTLPEAVAGSITGYVSKYQDIVQITLRTLDDVQDIHELPKPFTAVYTFENTTNSSGTTDPTPAPLNNRVTFSSFKAVGVSNNSNAGGRFAFIQWGTGAKSNSNNFTGGIDLGKYYEVTITPDPGTILNLDKIILDTLQRTQAGVRQWSVRSSLDNYAANIEAFSSNDKIKIVSLNIFQIADRTTSTPETGCSVNFDSKFKGLTQPVTFRFYAYNAETTGGTFSLNQLSFIGSTQ